MVAFFSALAGLSKAHYWISHFPFALLVAIFIFWSHPLRKQLSRAFLFATFFLAGTGLGIWVNEGLAIPTWHFASGVGLVAASLWLNYGRYAERAKWAAAFTLALALLSGLGLSFGENYFRPRRHALVANHNPEFQKKIRPILDRKCVKCHDAGLSQNRLDLSSPAGILRSKTLLPFIVPGEPDRSGFYVAISEHPASSRHMPRMAGRLSPAEIELVRNWIATDGKLSAQRPLPKASFHDSEHWAFRKFSKPAVPASPGATEIDRFLAQSGWRAEPLASGPLHRRLSLTVTGLPPENVSQGYAALVDRYLASPHFGENFAAYWFDLVSFADGLGFDGKPIGSTSEGYRKYVIQSLNENRPFNRFLKEQLASSDIPEKDVRNPRLLQNQLPRHRDPYITADYAVNSIFAFSLGMEMRCARCHDHRSEPISQRNYLDLVNIFSGPMNLTGKIPLRAPLGRQFLDIYEGTSADLEVWRKQKTDQRLDMEDLADWLTNVDKGVGLYTSRVFVDHVWRFVFGRGFVTVAGNFGSGSPVPAEIDLLNWLTHDFIEHGFSIKHLLRRILLSEAFRSRLDQAGSPFAPRRLIAENVRDNLLAATGSLNRQWGPKNIDDRFVAPGAPETSVALPDVFVPGERQAINRRSIYFVRSRNLSGKELFSKAFGQPTGFECVPQRAAIPNSQEAVFYANNSFLAAVIGELTRKADFDRAKLVRDFYRRILSREPNESEQALWKAHFSRKESRGSVPEFFHTLLISTEFLYVP